MSLSQNNLKPAKGSTKNRKRIGRGNASGQGTYAGKGLKGQKSRSGVSGLKRLGMKKQLLQIPKVRGFKSLKPDNQVVNLTDLTNNFKDGEKVNPKTLVKKELVTTAKLPVKILGKGELKIKNLEFSNVKVSASVKEAIEKKGGKLISD